MTTTNPTPREYAASEHGFTGKRGRLPANILAEYEAKYGTYVKAAAPKAPAKDKVTKSDVKVEKIVDNGPDWKIGELVDMEDEKVISLLDGRRIAWKNEQSNTIEAAMVRNPKIEVAASGRRLVTFNAQDGHFKSVALASL